MSQDSPAMPSSQLELEHVQDLEHCYNSQLALEEDIADLLPCDSPPAHEYDMEDDDPPSHSCTPSLDLIELAEMSKPQQAPTPQQQLAWAQYAGSPFDANSPIETQLSDFVIADRYLMKCIIGGGSFGITYKALDTHNNDVEVAVKVAKARHTHDSNAYYTYDDFLQVEWNAYQHLLTADMPPITGFPDILSAGIQRFAPDMDNDDRPVFTVSYLAMELLGATCWTAVNAMRQYQEATACTDSGVDDSDAECSQPDIPSTREPSTAWVVETGKGMLKALADVHRRGYIHRDVKTENFCLDASGSNTTIKVIDFGFARLAYGYYSFRYDYSKRCASFWGTPNYASLSALMSYPQTPRDDLECLVYCLFEMEHPTLRLPWNRDLTTNEEAKDGWSMRQLERMSKKKEQAWRAACKRGEVPDYLIGYFNYITSLGPLDVPDYEWLEMQLDSGATGLEPPRAPIRRQLADWPSTGETYSRKDYAMYAISQIDASASKILPTPSSMQTLQDSSDSCSRKRSTTDSQVDQHTHKRIKSIIWPVGELSDDEKPSSISPACSESLSGVLDDAGLGSELLQLPHKASPAGGLAAGACAVKQLRRSHRLLAAVQLVADSQEE